MSSACLQICKKSRPGSENFHGANPKHTFLGSVNVRDPAFPGTSVTAMVFNLLTQIGDTLQHVRNKIISLSIIE